MKPCALAAALLLGALAPARAADPAEDFDASGLPAAAETFRDQQLLDALKHHKAGDLEDARAIQGMLAGYYRAQGDEARAAAAEAKSRPPAAPPPPVPTGRPEGGRAAPTPARKNATAKTPFSGRFYGMDGRLLHTWDFNDDGAFYHATAVQGAGTSVRTGERGTFEAAGGELILRVEGAASGFATPGVGGRSTALGGGADASKSTRRLKLKVLRKGEGIVLDGLRLKPKSW